LTEENKVKLRSIVESINISKITHPNNFGRAKEPKDGWYQYKPSLKIYYTFLKDEKIQVFPISIPMDFDAAKKWHVKFFGYYFYLTQKQVEKVINGKIKKDRAEGDETKQEKIKKRFMEYIVDKHRQQESFIEYIHSTKLPNNKDLHTYFVKKKGVGLDDAFLNKTISVVQKVIDDNFSNRIKTAPQGKEIFYRLDGRKFQVGDTIKPSWGEDVALRSQQVIGADLGTAAEDDFEKYRPKSKPSRLKSVYCFKDLQSAGKYSLGGSGRKLYVVKPLGKYFFADMTYLEMVVGVYRSYNDLDYVFHGEYESKEYKDEVKKLEEEVKDYIKDYWAGKQSPHSFRGWEVLCEKGVQVIAILDI